MNEFTLKSLLYDIEKRQTVVGVIGLGYVGLPLLWTFHKKGFKVIGYDVDSFKIQCLEDGVSYIKHLGSDLMQVLSKSDRCIGTTEFGRLVESDVLLLCVPTPLSAYREPDMSYVIQTAETVSRHLRRGQLIILESTTYPGTTDELMIPILEKNSGLKSGVDFFVAYSPEREDPGNVNFNTELIPKVVGADGVEALELAVALYSAAIVQTVPVSDCKTAEAVKITENVFRSVNIALVNELKIVFEAMGIDVHEVLNAAATKPFGFMKFTPGPGLGGHCIPIDPFYLTWKAREFGLNTKFIELAGEINTSMPDYVMRKTIEALNTRRKSINGSRILMIGLAYKPDVDDMRESPTFVLMEKAEALGAHVDFYDPYISIIPPTREHSHYTGKKSIEWVDSLIKSYDAVIIATNHKVVDYRSLAVWSNLIVDTRNVYPGDSKSNIYKA
jgi:UDP-N-acetyl-D-glucosamine dehydrogenase